MINWSIVIDADLVPMKRELKASTFWMGWSGAARDADLVPMKRELKVIEAVIARAWISV